MIASDGIGYLPRLCSREGYVDYLEGLSTSEAESSTEGKPKRTRIKTYMLETARSNQVDSELDNLFPDRVSLERVDDTFYRVQDATHGHKVVGLIEAAHMRYPVFYTTLPSEDSKKWVRGAVDHNPWLDRLWLSSPILFELWQEVQHTTPPHRYIRLGFDHEAKYEVASSLEESDEDIYDEGEEYSTSDDNEDAPVGYADRRKSSVKLTERIGRLHRKLEPLIKLYDPLHSLVQLQIPGGDRGGHHFYYNGRATDWSDSFLEHRATVNRVVRLYQNVTARAEDRLWVRTDSVGEEGFSLTGAPVTIIFSEPLSKATFDRFVNLGLQRQRSLFRIGGYVTRRGPTKVHLAAIDHHLWQPFLLEATNEHLIVVLPRGTCGNTIHRLVTNVQRYLDPNVKVWLGDETYEHAVGESMKSA